MKPVSSGTTTSSVGSALTDPSHADTSTQASFDGEDVTMAVSSEVGFDAELLQQVSSTVNQVRSFWLSRHLVS